MKSCVFCQGNLRTLFEVALASETRQLLRCSTCSSCQLNEPFQDATLRSLYTDDYFQRQQWQLDKSRILAADYLNKYRQHGLIRPGSKALEIGAAYGFFGELLLRAGVDTSVLEMSADCREYMRTNFPALRQKGETLEDLSESDYYDFIFCQHVLEHLVDPSEFLLQVAAHLNPGGYFAALTPSATSSSFVKEGRSWGWACPEQHFEFLSPTIPKKYYESIGFELQVSTGVTPATIHFPSRWKTSIGKWRDQIRKGISDNHSLKNSALWLLCRTSTWLLECLEQNRPRQPLLALESRFDRTFGGSGRDELLLILRKRQH